MLRRCLYNAMLLLLLALPRLLHAADGDKPIIRFSVTPEKTRIVLDLPREVTFINNSTPQQPSVWLDIPLAAALPPVTVDDSIVSLITLAPDADCGMARLTITLKKPRKCTVYSQPADAGLPFRLVVDVLKRYRSEDKRALSPAITLTRLEEQTDDRYLVAHLLEVNTSDPRVHLRVVRAQLPRERIAAMVQRTGAVCGVNGGFFGDETRPLQLLKVDEQVLVMPIWKRCAVALPATGAPVFGNPDGYWRVKFSDGSARDMDDALNLFRAKGPMSTAVVDGNIVANAVPSPAGLTALVREDKVVSISTEVVTLKPGEKAIRLSAADRETLGKLLVKGAAVEFFPLLAPAWTEFPSACSAGPRLLREGKVDIPYVAENVQPDIRNGRHARTAIGVTAEGHAVLIVVEPPCPFGGGATLDELAAMLKAYGAVEGMNLDGGGSSNLAVGAVTVNYPPNTWIRPVADGILVYDDRAEVSGFRVQGSVEGSGFRVQGSGTSNGNVATEVNKSLK